MKLTNAEEHVRIMKSPIDVWSVVKEIANNQNQEDAFFVCDIGDIVNKYRIWETKIPRVVPYYAVKCNDDMVLLETLSTLGVGFDCASKSEINKVLSLGVSPDRIIFAHPAKIASHIRHAASVNVSTMVFDNEMELHKVKKLYPNAKLVIRIISEATDVQCSLGMKYGCDPINEAPKLLDLAKSLDLNVVGVSFHVGSGCREPAAYRRAISLSKQLFDYADLLGYNFKLLDIGGGYPGARGHSLFDEMADIINNALNDYFPDPSVNVIAEPGRFFAASAYTLACNIHSIRKTVTKDKASSSNRTHQMYYINDGTYGSFTGIVYENSVVKPQPLKQCRGRKWYSSSIWGPTCDGADQVMKETILPEMKIGEWIVFEDMGAYSLPIASEFNGFPIPKVTYVIDETFWLKLKDNVKWTHKHFQKPNKPVTFNVNNNDANAVNLSDLPSRIDLPQYGDTISYIDVSYM